MSMLEGVKEQLDGAQVAVICWLDAEGGAHYVGAGTEQPLSRLKVIGLLESTKMMIHHSIIQQNEALQKADTEADSVQ